MYIWGKIKNLLEVNIPSKFKQICDQDAKINYSSDQSAVNSIESASLQPSEIRKAIRPASRGSRKRVAYFTNMVLDWFDQRPRYGGGEKYCLNLARLLSEHGLEVDIYQIAPAPFTGLYNGYKVTALSHGIFYSEFNIDGVDEFYDISLSYDHVIYNMPELSSGKMRLDAISICHGIWFDHNNYGPYCLYRKGDWFKYLYRAFSNPRRVISVDSNSINVMRALWPELSHKMTFIPNFVDLDLFSPPEERANPKLKVLFPRRSQINRGSRILGKILHYVQHDVEFYWVGEGDDIDTQLILNLAKQDCRLHYEKATFDEMPSWCQCSDIVVIPTIACEGTSLSCIEALASGCATIATNVGGLPDIIQDGVNGRLVDPTPKAIAQAINELIENNDLRLQYQLAGSLSAKTFSLAEWKRKWLKIFSEERWINIDNRCISSVSNRKVVIVTRNAYHGGVETLIRLESEMLKAHIIVAGGLNNPDNTCPFPYIYIDSYDELVSELMDYDVILYHWPVDWVVQAIHDSGLPSIEFVHRIDTANCDKRVPTIIATHSPYISEYIHHHYGRHATIVPNVVDIDRFKPENTEKTETVIGAITSYYETKGIDIILDAWALIAQQHPDVKLRFYGSGNFLDDLIIKANDLKLEVEFCGPVSDPARVYHEFTLYITASRIEGLPLAVLEALATDVPVLASDIPGHTVINEMIESNGSTAPIILFKTEDSTDLAEKLSQFLLNKGSKINVRDSIKAVFSPQRHIDGLRSIIDEACSNNSTAETSIIELVEETTNNGVFSDGFDAEGFCIESRTRQQPSNVRSCSTPFIKATYDNFIQYRYPLPLNRNKLTCLFSCRVNSQTPILVQANWSKQDGTVVSMVCVSEVLNIDGTKVCASFDIPQDNSIAVVTLILRPDPGFIVDVIDINIKIWRIV